MSRPINLIECPFCHSSNVTFDLANQTLTCNTCGSIFMGIHFLEEDLTSYPSTAGTLVPEAMVETEETGYRRTKRLVLPYSHQQFIKFREDINELKSIVKELQNKFEGLLIVSPKVVVVEEVPKEEAKRRVEKYFEEHGTADIEELMLNLKIRVQTLVDIIDELRREGKISEEEEKS